MDYERSSAYSAQTSIMKRIFCSVLLIALVLPVFMAAQTVAAQDVGDNVFTLADLGLEEDMVLNGPYDSNGLRFDIPPTWQLKPGAMLQLEITSFFVGEGILTRLEGSTLVGATLEVFFNDVLQQSIPLVEGNRVTYQIPITDDALVPISDAGWHEIAFFLDAALDCDLDFHRTTVVIDTNSKAVLQYDQAPLSLDLRKLPWPIYQERRKFYDPVTVVIPDAPSAEELQSALVVMGSFARMTGGKLPVNMISVSQMTDEIKAQAHLLMVGKASAFSILNEFSLPVPLVGNGFISQEGTDEDGVVQIISSPWNDERVIILISGASDQAVIKSSQAVSTLNLQTGITPDYSIVAQVNPVSSLGVMATDLTLFNSPDITFEDLGFESVDISGLGTNWQSYEFVIPPGQIPAEGPYLDMNYSVSELVDPLRSEGVVYLNDVRIGSMALESEASNLGRARINMPASILRPGVNNLDIAVNLIPKDECSVSGFSGLWVTLYSDSLLHLPLTEVSDTDFVLQDIRAYPYPFSNDPSLSSTTIVVPQQDFASWLEAGKIAYDLGARISGPMLAFSVAFDGQIKEELQANNFILVGQPKDLTLLSGIKDGMPAHFEDGSNVAVLDTQQVIYRVAADKDLGYLQLFPSPWNDQGAILGMFGTSPAGLGFAVNAIVDPVSRDQLSGNFATLDGGSPVIIDTRTGLGLGRLNSSPNLTVDVVETITPSQSVPDTQTTVIRSRQMIITAMIGVIVLMFIVIIVALRSRRRSL